MAKVKGCWVQAGTSVDDWDGKLTPTQCGAFPAMGKEETAAPGYIFGFGQGSFAQAYQHAEDPTKVVKFTADAADAEASALVAETPLKGTVRVFKVARLKGQTGTAPVMDEFGDFEELLGQPIFGIITEKVDETTYPQYTSISAVWNQYKANASIFRAFPPNEFNARDFVDPVAAADYCVIETGADDETCREVVNDVLDAVNEQAHKIGVIPLDIPPRNWGSRNGKPVILDLGVSAGRNAPRIETLAGTGKKGQKHMARRHRSHRRRHLGETTEMAVYNPDKPSRVVGINWKSPWLWGGLAAIGLIAFWPKKAKASEKKPVEKAPDVPVGSGTGTESTVPTGGTTTLATDPGSGTPVAGPTGSIVSEMKRTVAKGESWANIASRAYGDYRWWPALWDYNRSGGAKFKDPGLLRVGDEIMVPALPQSAAFKVAIFARAEADRAWEIERARAKKAGKKFSKPRPLSTMTATPFPAVTLPPGSPVSTPPAGSGGLEKTVPSAKEPLVMGPGSSGAPPTNQNPVPADNWDELGLMEQQLKEEISNRR